MPLNLNDPATWETGSLPTAAGTVPFWWLADWDAYSEQWEDENSQTHTLVAVSWFDAALFRRYALGFTERVGAPTYFQRYAPLAFPYQPEQYLRSLKKVRILGGTTPAGAPELHEPDPFGDNFPTFPAPVGGMPARIVYAATFTNPPYDILTQDVFEAGSRRELRRYVQREQQITPRERKVPSFGYETYNAAAPATMDGPLVVPISEVGFVPDYTTEFIYTWRKIPVQYVPGAAIAACVNKTNDAVFDFNADGTYGRFPVGTMLFAGLVNRVVPYRDPNGKFLVDLPYRFRYVVADGAADSWNKLPRPDGTFSPIRARGTNPPVPLYRTGNIEALFQPGP